MWAWRDVPYVTPPEAQGPCSRGIFATLLFQRNFCYSAHLVVLLKEWQWQKIRFKNKENTQKCLRTELGATCTSEMRPMAKGWNEIIFKALPSRNHSGIVGFQHFPSSLSWGEPYLSPLCLCSFQVPYWLSGSCTSVSVSFAPGGCLEKHCLSWSCNKTSSQCSSPCLRD